MFERSKKFTFSLKNFKHWRLLGLTLAGLGLLLSSGGILTLFLVSPAVVTSPVMAGSPEFIFVDVSGAVVRPGIYQLEADQRLAAALELAGGLSDEASGDFVSTTLNLSARLSDEEKIHIYSRAEWDDLQPTSELPVTTNKADLSAQSSGLISLNQASQSELESLSGIGEKRAQEIIQNRPFSDLNELVSKQIISETLFAEIKTNLKL